MKNWNLVYDSNTEKWVATFSIPSLGEAANGTLRGEFEDLASAQEWIREQGAKDDKEA